MNLYQNYFNILMIQMQILMFKPQQISKMKISYLISKIINNYFLFSIF